MQHDTERAALVEAIQNIAKDLGADSVPRHEFLRKTGFSERKILVLFGSYNELVVAAGLKPQPFPTADSPKYSDEELLNQIVRVLRLPNSRLTRIYFDQNSESGKSSGIERRFGGWIAALRLASSRLDANTEKQLIERVNSYVSPSASDGQNGPVRSAANETTDGESESPALESDASHQLLDGSANLYGDFINFRGLQHAPVNEQGVVFLFGMICRELGYVVEIVKPGFPDCEAKRRIRGKSGMWQRVRIEFEFQSRSFRSHGHDPDQCDLIVCWEDNWTDCPIEVLELSKVLKGLPKEVGG
jgi:hypothetical protein